MRNILILNGPNLDMLGIREPGVYGTETLANLEARAASHASARGARAACAQSNSESQLIEMIHQAAGVYDGIVYNPGAHTHYSYALRDAVASVDVPVVEVHISDISDREPFRRLSVIAPACVAQVKGLGFEGYCRAIDILCESAVFKRLGEGFESRYPESLKVIVGGLQPQVEAGESLSRGEDEAVSNDVDDDSRTDVAQLSFGDLRIEADPMSVELPEPFSRGERAMMGAKPGPAFSCGENEAASASRGVAFSRGEGAPAAVARLACEFDWRAEPCEDYAEPYADDVAAVDAGLMSFERLSLVRAACAQQGVDALLVRDTPNIQWLTAIDGVFDEERAHALLVTRDQAVLHTDSRYSNAARVALGRMGGEVRVNDGRLAHAAFAAEELGEHSPDGAFVGRLGIEDTITYAEFAKTVEAFGAAHLAATSDLVLQLRAVKTGAELSRLLAAQAVTDAAFLHIVAFIRPGMTEREVQLELEDFMVRHGGEGLAFRSIVATGANGADPHAVPGATRLEAGQCIVMDFGAKAYGYCADMTRMVFLGQPSGLMAQAWDVLRRANETVEAMLRPGVTGKQAHELAESILAEGGFAGRMGHGLGHGVGIEVHELPVLNSRNDKPLAVGNVVTVEPGIYLPGQFGMRLEDCGVITQAGYEVFSELGHDMVVI